MKTFSDSCVFCEIVNKKRSAKILYEDEAVLAFYDINPQAPVHILLIPKKHIKDLLEIEEKDKEVLGHIFFVINKIAKDLNLSGFRVITNTGKSSGQTVFHLHFHILSGRKFSWPPG